MPTRLAYRLTCDVRWRTREGTISGWVDGSSIEFRVARTPEGIWTLNDHPILNLESCVDLDFGFTPATNLSQLRRIALEIGQATDVPVAWFDLSAGTLALLHQRYERRTMDSYWYEAPRFDYAALLDVRSSGLVRRYPGLWEEQSSARS